jgi:hypothetical protein
MEKLKAALQEMATFDGLDDGWLTTLMGRSYISRSK